MNFLPFSLNLKLLAANSSSLEQSKICLLGKGYLLITHKKNLNSSKFIVIADKKLIVAQDMFPIWQKLENILGKGENAAYQHFSFSNKCCSSKVAKTWDSVVKS